MTLRTAFVGLTVALAILARIVNGAHRQARIVGMIRSKGGECYYKHQYARRPGVICGELNPDAPPRYGRWLCALLGIDILECVAVVVLKNGSGDPEVIRATGDLCGLQEVYVVKNRISSEDVEALQTLCGIQVIGFRLTEAPQKHLVDRAARFLPRAEIIVTVISKQPSASGSK